MQRMLRLRLVCVQLAAWQLLPVKRQRLPPAPPDGVQRTLLEKRLPWLAQLVAERRQPRGWQRRALFVLRSVRRQPWLAPQLTVAGGIGPRLGLDLSRQRSAH